MSFSFVSRCKLEKKKKKKKRLPIKISVILCCAYSQIHWASLGAGQVLSADLDGTGIEPIVQGLTGPTAVTIDTKGKYLHPNYFHSSHISRVDKQRNEPGRWKSRIVAIFLLFLTLLHVLT